MTIERDYSKEWAEMVKLSKSWLKESTCPLQEDEVIQWADDQLKRAEYIRQAQVRHIQKLEAQLNEK